MNSPTCNSRRFFTILILGLLLPMGILAQGVNVPEANLEAAIRTTLRKPAGGKLLSRIAAARWAWKLAQLLADDTGDQSSRQRELLARAAELLDAPETAPRLLPEEREMRAEIEDALANALSPDASQMFFGASVFRPASRAEKRLCRGQPRQSQPDRVHRSHFEV